MLNVLRVCDTYIASLEAQLRELVPQLQAASARVEELEALLADRPDPGPPQASP